MPRHARGAGLDYRHGRQGGRIVQWQPIEVTVGEVITIDSPEFRHPHTRELERLTVTAVSPDGKVVARFASGAELIISAHDIERTP